MKCVKCGGNLKGYSSIDIGDEIHRCRMCENCGHKIYTSEVELSSDKDFLEASREYNRQRKLKKMAQTTAGDDGVIK